MFCDNEYRRFHPNEKWLFFWCCSEIFCRFWSRFCINYFNIFQNSKHEKRLETDVSSSRNPVIMREIMTRLTFADCFSTNWAYTTKHSVAAYEHCSLAGNMTRFCQAFFNKKTLIWVSCRVFLWCFRLFYDVSVYVI